MTDDQERVVTALQAGLDEETAVRIAWAEAETACPAAVLLPARCIPVCTAAGETLLTEITQSIRLTARSYAQLTRLAGQTEDAMLTLGYTLIDMKTDKGIPRSMMMQFSGIADGERMHCQHQRIML